MTLACRRSERRPCPERHPHGRRVGPRGSVSGLDDDEVCSLDEPKRTAPRAERLDDADGERSRDVGRPDRGREARGELLDRLEPAARALRLHCRNGCPLMAAAHRPAHADDDRRSEERRRPPEELVPVDEDGLPVRVLEEECAHTPADERRSDGGRHTAQQHGERDGADELGVRGAGGDDVEDETEPHAGEAEHGTQRDRGGPTPRPWSEPALEPLEPGVQVGRHLTPSCRTRRHAGGRPRPLRQESGGARRSTTVSPPASNRSSRSASLDSRLSTHASNASRNASGGSRKSTASFP